MDTIRQDLRYALRQLARNPGFTLVAVLTLGLGIGANSTMFGVLDALFLSPPPGVAEPDRIARIYIVRDEGMVQTPDGGVGSYPDHSDLSGTQVFAAVAGQFSSREMSFGRGESAEKITGAVVTGGYFATLGSRPALGRFIGPADDTVPAAPVAVVSHAFWQNRFQGSANAIGEEIFLEGNVYTVIGVAPEYFHGIDNEAIDIWLPTAMVQGEEFLTNRLHIGLGLFGRLRPGVPIERAQEEAASVLRNAAEASGLEIDPTPGVILAPGNEALGPKRSEAATTALWLGLVAGGVLLIACANVANLLLARATRRRREIGVRLALGASRTRLLRQLLTESVVLALLGGAAAVLLTVWSAGLIRLFPLPPIASLIDGRMLAFTFAVSLLTGILAGLVPALQAGIVDLVPALKDGASSEGPSRSRLRGALTITQMALSLVLLIGAGLLVRSVIVAQSVDSGIDIDRLLYVSVDLGDAGYEGPAQEAFLARAVERLRGMPGITGVDFAQFAPVVSGPAYGMGFEIPGIESSPQFEGGGPWVNFVGPEFFRTVGSAMLRGRAFTEADGEGSPPVVIVNERMADLYWPAGDALGGCMEIGDECVEVVGVSGNIKHRLLEDAIPKFYIPAAQQDGRASWSNRTIILRTSSEPSAMIGNVQSAVHGLAPDLPYVSVLPVTELLGPDLRPFRIGATLFSLFGALALALAAIGLYGVVSFSVAQQTREIGVRIALGAEGGDVLRLVVSRAMALTLIGVVIGLTGAVAVTRYMESLLYGVETLDTATFLAVPLLLIGIALLASYLPARRATRVDPMVALRAE
jgi:predicted permease